jgi:predicted DNA-binding protein
METTTGGETPKLSSARSLNFRPGPAIRAAIDDLAAETGRNHSDIIRDGITAYWPEIEALNRNLARNAAPGEVNQLRAWVDSCAAAARQGLDPAAILTDACTAALETA